MNTFVDPPRGECQHAKRIRVYLHYLWSINHMNTLGIMFHHFKFIDAKVVPRMDLGSPQHQHWTHNHVLPLRCGRVHHKGSMNPTKFVLVCKLCLVTHIWPLNNMKFVSKMIENCKMCSKNFDHTFNWDAHTTWTCAHVPFINVKPLWTQFVVEWSLHHVSKFTNH